MVVVSAIDGVTDRLLDRLVHFPNAGAADRDLLLATGEIASTALFTAALRGEGILALGLNPWQLGIRARTDEEGGGVDRVNSLGVLAALSRHDAVVCPGFVGVTAAGVAATLGRGGSDLTAIALAEAVDASICEFIKDVPGYFSADPKRDPAARQLPTITLRAALELAQGGCELMQERALLRARTARTRLVVRALDDPRATAIVA